MYDFFIIIPCYNEFNRLDVDRFYNFSIQNRNYKLIFVDDGSTDKTLSIIKNLSLNSQNISFISYKKNMGKAYAVRHGVLNVLENLNHGNTYIGFLDADLSISTKEIDHLYKSVILNEQLSLIYYMKNKSEYYRGKYLRHFVSISIQKINKLLYQINIEDTQCGCKIFKSEIASSIFKEKFNSKWLFDIEIFLRLIYFKDASFLENNTQGIKNNHIYLSKKSKIKYFMFFQIIIDYFKIYIKYKPLIKKIDN